MGFAVGLVASACLQPAALPPTNRESPSGSPASTPAAASIAAATASPAPAAAPIGTVAYFRLASCPGGWSKLEAAAGRTVVGLPSGGTIGGTVGSPLADLEDRAHTHVVPPISVTTGTAGVHVHVIDPPRIGTSFVASISVPMVGAFDAAGWVIGAASHQHAVDIKPFDSEPGGEHSHQATIPARETNVAGTGQVTPYVQLLACRNDSDTATAVPPGAAVFFNLATCPAGWSELSDLGGRAVVGLTTGGTLQGTVGQPLADLEDRHHSHTLRAASVDTSYADGHAHRITAPVTNFEEFPSVQAKVVGGAAAQSMGPSHGHSVRIPSELTAVAGGHLHQVLIPQSQTTTSEAGQVVPYLQLLPCGSASTTGSPMPSAATAYFRQTSCPAGWSELAEARGRAVVGIHPGGSVGRTISQAFGDLEDREHRHAATGLNMQTTFAGGHLYSIDPPPAESSGSGIIYQNTDFFLDAPQFMVPSHTHQVNIPPFVSGSEGMVSHRVTLPTTATTVARTGQVMPYVQMLVCSKG